MVHVHAALAGFESRATKDADMLIDVMASSAYIAEIIHQLHMLGFEVQEPGLRGSAFHRMRKDNFVVDVLVADHLPSKKLASAKFNRWPMMETPGGAQAIERKMNIRVQTEKRSASIWMPDLLGALVLKAAAYSADRRDQRRHLDDAALLASLITNHAGELKRLHGSDKKRLRNLEVALKDRNAPSWLLLPEAQRIKGQDTLRILAC